jgi:hypothetical protein
MSVLVKFLAYGVVGMILAFLNVIFISRIVAEFRDDIPPDPIIGPFRIIGKKADDQAGVVMAQLLVARVDSLGTEIATTIKYLTEGLPKTSGPRKAPAARNAQSMDKPEEQRVTQQMHLGVIDAPSDVRLSVAGVEVGGILPWVQRYLVAGRMLNVSVQYQKDKVVVAATTTSSSRSIWMELKPRGTLHGIVEEVSDPSAEEEDDTAEGASATAAPATAKPAPVVRNPVYDLDVITDLAYALQKQKFETLYPQLRTLDRGQFRDFLDLLGRAAALNQRTAAQVATESDYQAVLTEIERFLARPDLGEWPSMLELAGQVAERAGRFKKGIGYYESAKEFATSGKTKSILDERITEARRAQLARTTEGDREIARIARAFALETGMPVMRKPVVAVVGLPPPPSSMLHYRIIGDHAPAVKTTISEHTWRAMSVVHDLAPEAQLAVVTMRLSDPFTGEFSTPVLLEAIAEARKAGPDVLIVPYGPFDAATILVLAAMPDQGVIVVIPAGNNSEAHRAGNESDLSKILIAGATDIDGSPAEFSGRGTDVIWAPGVHVPVRVDEDQWNYFSGTTFSAAGLGALAARVLAVTEVGGQAVVSAIRKSAEASGGVAPTPQFPDAVQRAREVAPVTVASGNT